jgi:hypothetical protein
MAAAWLAPNCSSPVWLAALFLLLGSYLSGVMTFVLARMFRAVGKDRQGLASSMASLGQSVAMVVLPEISGWILDAGVADNPTKEASISNYSNYQL